MAERVTYELDEAIDYPRQFVGDVEFTLADGRAVRERQDRPRGGPDAPMTREELEAKFRGNARLALPEPRVEQIIGTVKALTADRSLVDLVASLSQ